MRMIKPLRAEALETHDEPMAVEEDDGLEFRRVHCPDCARPIALFAEDSALPLHALCPTPWDPFGLTVCQGSGRRAPESRPVAGGQRAGEEEGLTLTLPDGLDWRTQPFSHAGGPGSRPLRLRAPRQPQRI